MCGINGIIGKSAGQELSAIMNSAMRHRGPDNSATFHHDNCSLGHVRLSILDLSDSANQPFVSSCGNYVIIFNGEIYNYKEVKEKLLAKTPTLIFRTSSDTEILLQAFMELGVECLELLNGMFAFAIWQKEKQELFIARDRAGEKPVYYHKDSNNFIFASEIRSLLSSGLIPRQLNEKVLNDYLNYQTVHAPETLIKNVKMLLPGHFMTVKNNEVKTQPYWKINNYIKKNHSENPISTIKSIFEKSIRLRMVADVEVGAFLSGGIDSSAVVAQMSQLSKSSVSTFSVIFGEKDFSEEEYSNQVAKKYNTNHHPLHVNANDFLNQIPSILKSVDFPGGDGPNTYVVAEATRKTGIKVALSGLGGDELFAGYPIFRQATNFHGKKLLRNSPQFLRKMGGSLASTIKKGTAGDKYKRILGEKKLNDATFYANSRRLFNDEQTEKMIKSDSADLPVYTIAQNLFKQIPEHLISEVSAAEISTYMQNVLLRDTDQMTMAHALEVRAPFLDHHLMEFVLGLTDEQKYPHTPKEIFVKAMGDLLPPEIVNRKKMGFTFPWAHWLRNELHSFCGERIVRLSERKYFDKEELQALWRKFENNDPSVPWSRIWHLVTLEEWMTNNNIE